VVSVVHLHKGIYAGVKLLERRPVEQITAFLFANGGHEDPKQLAANAGKSFVGSYLLGVGFTFDDSGPADDETPGIPSPIATMERLLATNPTNADVIFPYIGGEEVNDTPSHSYHRYAIDFRDRSEEECRSQWPDLMDILERKVKPQRQERKANGEFKQRHPLPLKWWIHSEKRPALYAAISSAKNVMVVAQTSKYKGFTFLEKRHVFDQKLVVFAFKSANQLATLQSTSHLEWAQFLGGTLEDRPVYTPSDCFETFPFPDSLLDANANDPAHEAMRQSLEAIGERYHQYRAELMVANN